MGRPEVQLSPKAEAALQEYAWPGNLRELSNVLERAMVLQKGDHLEVGDLGLDGRRPSQGVMESELVTMKEMERLHIERVLQRCHSNVTVAAQILGMARRTLYDRLKVLGIAIGKD